ncbi:caspase family protein [Streptomyces sp. NPDC051172]|uniref:caspase family protein n=1 Tax=Streptomyces sp. NPDC051172 TaxID=3155796 RepID=UPI003418AE93
MTRFPEAARSRAVLIGTSRFPKAPELPSIPAVAANLNALRQVLTDAAAGTITPELCQVVSDPVDMQRLGPLLSNTIREATDVLLVYYAGHGLLDDKGRLYLSLTGTEPSLLRYTALPLDTLREELASSPAAIRILILDCCFSGRAIEAMGDEQGLIIGQLEVAGTYTLTSTTANAPSHAPSGETYTAFTGALLQALRQSGPQTLDAIYQRVTQSLATRGLPRPQRRALNTAGDLALARGPASAAPPSPAHDDVRFRPDTATAARNRRQPMAIGGVGTLFFGWIFTEALRTASPHWSDWLSWVGPLMIGIPMLLSLWLFGAALFASDRHVATLVLNSEEIRFMRGRGGVRVPWTDISHVGLMRGSVHHPVRQPHQERLTVLAVRLRAEAPVPKTSTGLSRAHRELGYVGICVLGAIGADRRNLLAALECFAGPRLVRTPRDFLHIDPRLSPDMV